jgi:hypothetical protein
VDALQLQVRMLYLCLQEIVAACRKRVLLAGSVGILQECLRLFAGNQQLA